MDKTNSTKVKEWKEKLKLLEEEELPKAKERVGNAAETGDWEENAEFEDAERQVEVIQGRISDIKQLIRNLEKGS
jgi:transcription elongation GreA/GreB family factor